jgi:membrane protein DedA with SNARE-associated domain
MMLPVTLLAGTLKLRFIRFVAGVLLQLGIWIFCIYYLGNAVVHALPVPVLDVSFILHWLIAASLTITGIAIIIMLAKKRFSFNTVSAD